MSKPIITVKSGTNEKSNGEQYKWLNWIGEYTYGSVCDKYNYMSSNGKICFTLDKCMFANNYMFTNNGSWTPFDIKFIKKRFEDDQRIFRTNLDVENHFGKHTFYDCVSFFFPEEKWPQFTEEFLFISNDQCQKEFILEPQYNNDDSKYALRTCFEEKYRYVFRHKYTDNIHIHDCHEMIDQLKENASFQGISHEYIFSHDKEAMVKIQKEIDHVNQCWNDIPYKMISYDYSKTIIHQ